MMPLPVIIHEGLSAAPDRRADPAGRLTDLEARLDRALLVCEALWSLLRERLNMDDVELVQRINDIDLSDGRLDGKVRRTAVACPSCKRTISRKFPKCMYCGQQIVHDPFS